MFNIQSLLAIFVAILVSLQGSSLYAEDRMSNSCSKGFNLNDLSEVLVLYVKSVNLMIEKRDQELIRLRQETHPGLRLSTQRFLKVMLSDESLVKGPHEIANCLNLAI